MNGVILCVDDEADLRLDVCAELEAAGYTVYQAGDGIEALRQIDAVRPDLILCDIRMPGLSGHEVLAELRGGDGPCQAVPFILLTAHADRENQLSGRRAGADDYLVKPVDFDLLLATVEARLTNVRRLRDAGQSHIRELERQITKLKGQGGPPFPGVAPDLLAFIAEALPVALEQEALTVHLQPKLSLSTGQVVGAEALVRWTDPERGAISPAVFVPVAERLGLIGMLSEQVMRLTVAHCLHLRSVGLDMPVSFNLSGMDLTETLPGLLGRLLAEAGLPPESVQVEITESAAIGDPAMAMTVVQALRELGVGTAIDDFGTGYASLAYVRDFHVQGLKIDQTFVHALREGATEQYIIENILALCRAMGLAVVAEGVETQAQATLLQNLGCDCVQGWLFSRALPLADFVTFAAPRNAVASQTSSSGI